MSALVALTLRTMSGSRRDADLLFAALAPVGCFLGFTLVLGGLIRTGSMSYSQYVLPVVIVQAMLFGAMTTADRAARDRLSGFGSRLRTLPLPASVPLGARMLYCLTRALIALAATIAAGWSFGFRMQGGPADAVLFVTIVVVFAMAVCLGADALGSRVGTVESSSQLLLLPQLVLVLLSTGIAPAESFPAWMAPFIRNQPVSQVTEALRGLCDRSRRRRQSGGGIDVVPRPARGIRCCRGAYATTRRRGQVASTPSRSQGASRHRASR